MTKQIKHVALLGFITLLVSMVGCQQANLLRCQYRPDQSERIKVTQQRKYESWVEMPGKEPAQHNSRENKQELTLLRQVESVASDGSALMTVTIEKAEVTLDINTQNSKSKHRYISTAGKTDNANSVRVNLRMCRENLQSLGDIRRWHGLPG